MQTTVRLKAVVSLVAIALVAMVIAAASSVNAQRGRETQPQGEEVKAWEYCMLTGCCESKVRDGKSVSFLRITYLTADGGQTQDVEMEREVASDAYYREAAALLPRTIAKLGSEGWEMVGQAPYDNKNALYFKRPKR